VGRGAVNVSWNVWCVAPEFSTFPRKAVENYEHEAAAGGLSRKLVLAGASWLYARIQLVAIRAGKKFAMPCLRPGECTVYGCMKCVPADMHRYRTACVVPLLCEHPSEGLDIDNQLVAVSVRVRRHRSGTAHTAAETFPQVFNALHS
jgi:hypothetical protein